MTRLVSVLALHVPSVHVPSVELLLTQVTLEVTLALALASVAGRVLAIRQQDSAYFAREVRCLVLALWRVGGGEI